MDLADLREQIHDGCSVAVQVERRVRGQRDPVRLWIGAARLLATMTL